MVLVEAAIEQPIGVGVIGQELHGAATECTPLISAAYPPLIFPTNVVPLSWLHFCLIWKVLMW